MGIELNRKGQCKGQVDLHMHSWFSDGLFGLQLAIAANFLGLQAVALADHHTGDGTEKFRIACNKFGIETVPCMEVTTRTDNGRKMDVLLYYPTYTNQTLVTCLEAILEEVDTEIEVALDVLKRAGLKLWGPRTLKQHFPEGLHSMHHLKEMLKRRQQLGKLGKLGQLMQRGELEDFDGRGALGQTLDALGRRFQVTINYPSIKNLLLMAHEDGAVPLIAHAWRGGITQKTLEHLKKEGLFGPEGLMGFELPSNPLDKWNTEFMLSVLTVFRESGIDPVITIGNDYHGGWSDMGGPKKSSAIQLGEETVNHKEVVPHLQAAKEDKRIIVMR